MCGCGPGRSRIEGAALIGADGLRSTIRHQMPRRGRAANDRLCRPSHHRADGRGARPTCIATKVVLWSGSGLSHRALSAPRRARCSTSSRCFAPRPMPRRGEIARYRAETRPHVSGFASDDEGAAGDDGPGAALGDLRPRSDPPLEQRSRHACRRRRAPDLAIAGAGRLHGDRGRRLRWPSASSRPAAISPQRSALTKAPAISGPRGCNTSSATSGTISITSAASSAKSCASLRPRAASRTCSIASPGSCLTGFRLPAANDKAA